mmetsp:Transcript_11284/g.33926  ORF Transcript_11284/g.33926 Transcript_11284/m.33926 type:complete len:431 (-) Transcript_11284:848-2140(-)
MGRLPSFKAQRRARQRRCVLLFLAAAVVVTFLAYERDEVVRDAEIILHHNLTNHTAARSAPVKDKAAAATVASPKDKDPTIFVSAIAYREPECHPTLKDMFAKAALPDRVYAGVCQQNFLPAGSKEDCAVNQLPEKYQSHVKIFAMNSTEAEGIPLARARASQQYDGQDYWLQIDAHSRFDDGWDQRLIDEYKRISECDPKAMLSTYPPAISMLSASANEKRNMASPRICNGSYTGGPNNMHMFRYVSEVYSPKGFAVRTGFASGGFMFGPGQILRDVPHDPNMPMLFDGDEVLFSVRLFTAGWNVWAPSEQVVYHRYVSYGERNINVFADRQNGQWLPHQVNSTKRVMYVLGMTDELPPEDYRAGLDTHGLGKVRSMDDWVQWSGIDFKDPSHVAAGDKFCRDVTDLPMDKSRVCPISSEAKAKFAQSG